MRFCSALSASKRPRQSGRARGGLRSCLPARRIGAGALSLLALLAGTPEPARTQGPTYVLRIGDEVGQSNRYRIAFEIRMEAEFDSEMEPDAETRRLIALLADGMVLRTAMDYEQTLERVAEDGTRVFRVRWHGFELAGEIGEMAVPPPPGHLESRRRLLRQSARMRVTPTGRTLAVSYSDPGLAGLAGDIESLGRSMPTYLPDRPVRVGDTWSSVTRFPVGRPGSGGMGSLELELRHRLVEVRDAAQGPVAVIRLSGSYSRLQGIGDAPLGAPMHMEATLSGSTRFDIRRGRFIDGHYEIDMLALQAEEGVEVELTGRAVGELELLDGR